MGSYERLLARLQAKPKDFSWAELQKVMSHEGYGELTGSGSRRKFYNSKTGRMVNLHKRHPDDTLLAYQINEVLKFFRQEGVI